MTINKATRSRTQLHLDLHCVSNNCTLHCWSNFWQKIFHKTRICNKICTVFQTTSILELILYCVKRAASLKANVHNDKITIIQYSQGSSEKGFQKIKDHKKQVRLSEQMLKMLTHQIWCVVQCIFSASSSLKTKSFTASTLPSLDQSNVIHSLVSWL